MKIFAANWKLNKNPEETRTFFKQWTSIVKVLSDRKIVFFPPATNLETTSQCLKDTGFEFGSQNCFFETQGAFTGEISAKTVADMGGRWILVGHSERRK